MNSLTKSSVKQQTPKYRNFTSSQCFVGLSDKANGTFSVQHLWTSDVSQIYINGTFRISYFLQFLLSSRAI